MAGIQILEFSEIKYIYHIELIGFMQDDGTSEERQALENYLVNGVRSTLADRVNTVPRPYDCAKRPKDIHAR